MVKLLFFLHTFILTTTIFSSIDPYNLRIILKNQNELLQNNPYLFRYNSFPFDIELNKAELILNYRIVTGRFISTPTILNDTEIDTIINNRRTISNIQDIQKINLKMANLNGCITRLTELLK